MQNTSPYGWRSSDFTCGRSWHLSILHPQTLQSMLTTVKKGRAVDEAEIPPPVATGASSVATQPTPSEPSTPSTSSKSSPSDQLAPSIPDIVTPSSEKGQSSSSIPAPSDPPSPEESIEQTAEEPGQQQQQQQTDGLYIYIFILLRSLGANDRFFYFKSVAQQVNFLALVCKWSQCLWLQSLPVFFQPAAYSLLSCLTVSCVLSLWFSSKRGNQGTAGGETEGVQGRSAEGQEAGRSGASSTLLEDQQGLFLKMEVWFKLK